jgi:hypothetical protein
LSESQRKSAEERLAGLVELLLAGTRAGRLGWVPAIDNGVYRLELESGFVTIGGAGESYSVSFRRRAAGQTIASIISTPGADHPLRKLYEIVHESQSEESLDQVMAELRGKMTPEAPPC